METPRCRSVSKTKRWSLLPWRWGMRFAPVFFSHLRRDGVVDSVSRRSKQRCRHWICGTASLKPTIDYAKIVGTQQHYLSTLCLQYFPNIFHVIYSMYISLNTHLGTHFLDVWVEFLSNKGVSMDQWEVNNLLLLKGCEVTTKTNNWLNSRQSSYEKNSFWADYWGNCPLKWGCKKWRNLPPPQKKCPQKLGLGFHEKNCPEFDPPSTSQKKLQRST